jgi:hypothetical protein
MKSSLKAKNVKIPAKTEASEVCSTELEKVFWMLKYFLLGTYRFPTQH